MLASPKSTAAKGSPIGLADDGSLPANAVAAWVAQLARALKTCRLYDGENPTVIKFREDVARELARLLAEGAPLSLGFTSTDVVYREASVYAARSREDNLARPFFRDGISAITFHPGMQPGDFERFLDQMLRVTAANSADEDFVTLLWDAQIPHLDFEYAPTIAEGDAGADLGGGGESPAATSLLPWPASGGLSNGGGASEGAASDTSDTDRAFVEGDVRGRSDDWQTNETAVDIEPAFARLEAASETEIARFRAEIEAELCETAAESALRVIGNSLSANAKREDHLELGLFLPRVLRDTTRTAQWKTARESLILLRECDLPGWSVLDLMRELLDAPSGITAQCVAALDQQPDADVDAFLEFAKELGAEGVEWLMTVLAQSQQKRVRRPLTKVIADLSRQHPERLRPWLAHPQWYVVRNVVHILGWIGGANVVRLLRDAAAHSEPRVRQEVVAALNLAPHAEARPILLRMLETADGRLLTAVLHQVSAQRDPAVAKKLLDFVLDPAIGQRPPEETHLIFMALAGCGGDEVLAPLETKLFEGGWFARTPDAYRRAVARCVARIGSAKAVEVLHRGARARRPAVRIACEEALTKSRGTD
ncbi:MAG: HEAT repeat domain-containing protein [bacterium]